MLAATCVHLLSGVGASTHGFARSALELLRHGDLAALARALGNERVCARRMNGRDVYFVSCPKLARQVCVEHAAAFADRNDPRSADFGVVSAVGAEWASNRIALRTALVGVEVSAAHARLALEACSSPCFRQRAALASGVAQAAQLVRSTTTNIIAELVLGRPPRAAEREVWRPLPAEVSAIADLERAITAANSLETESTPTRWLRVRNAAARAYSRLRARAARTSVPVGTVFLQQVGTLAAVRMPFFDFAKAFTASRAARISRARERLAGTARPAGESDADLVRIALAACGRAGSDARAPAARAAADRRGAAERGAAGGAPTHPGSPPVAQASACASVLDVLLQSGRTASDAGVPAVLEELLVAGSGTTATAALSALAALHSEPALARAAREEAARGLERLASAERTPGGRPPSVAACLPLLSACVREGMRLNPPAPLIFRVARADVALLGPGGEAAAIVRAGSAVVMSTAVLATDPATWHASREFLPERWLPGGASTAAEMSFGAGPRSCVGSQLAMVVAPIVVASILRDWPGPA